MEITTWQKAEELTRKWLTEDGHSIEEQKDDNANFHFVIDAPPKSHFKQSIIQPKQTPETVIVVLPVGISQEHADALRKMEQKAREKFVWSVLKVLIFNENAYQLERDQEGIPKKVVFTYELPFDELKKQSLQKAMNLNYRSFLYLIEELRIELEGVSISDPSEMFG